MRESWGAALAEVEKWVKEYMSRYDPSHDWHHVERVRIMALSLAKTISPAPDMKVVELAALLHDVSDSESRRLSESILSHWIRSVKYTSAPLDEILEPVWSKLPPGTLDRAQIELIERIIPAVSYSTETRLRAAHQWTNWHEECQELAAVQDADRLDAIGAIGIMRCAAYSGVKGRALLKIDGKENMASAEGHFDDKLLKIKDMMKTPAGREEAERRHESMMAFLDGLNREKRNLDVTIES